MYLPTGNDDVFALDAKTGRKIWQFNSDIPQVNDLICGGWDSRGVRRMQLEDYHDGYSITGSTRYFDGLVFTGMAGGENGIRGRMYALDARTGNEVWRFYTIPAPGEPGAETWPTNTDAWTHGGATVWQGPAIDPTWADQEPRQATAATQPYPVGDAVTNQCPDPLPQFPLSGCVFAPFWDIPVLMRPGLVASVVPNGVRQPTARRLVSCT